MACLYPQIEWPYTNVHQLNLDWVLSALKSVVNTLNEQASTIEGLSEKIAALEKAISDIESALPGMIEPAVIAEIQKLIDDGTIGKLINEALMDEVFSSLYSTFSPYYHCFGGQMASLVADIGNPMCQMLGIVLGGDSITWGVGSTGASSTAPNTHRQDSARNNADSPSWANLFRKWMGEHFYPSATSTVSNSRWAPSGQSITTWTDNLQLNMLPSCEWYTAGINNAGNITTYTGANISGGGCQVHALTGTDVRTGIYFACASPTNFPFIKFHNFTGTGLTLYYNLNADELAAAEVQLYINGNYVAKYNSYVAAGGYSIPLQIGFDFVRGAEIELRFVMNSENPGQNIYLLRLPYIRIAKTIRISNNAISGVDWRAWTEFNIYGGVGGLPVTAVAIDPDDSYMLIMLGTNDQQQTPTNALYYMELMYKNSILTNCKTILITPPPNNTLYYPPEQVGVDPIRNIMVEYGHKNFIDVIDSYPAVEQYMDKCYNEADAIHPNDFGHSVLFSNIAHSLLEACYT